MLYVSLTSHVVHNCIVLGEIGSSLINLQWRRQRFFRLRHYLLKLVHKVHGIGFAFLVCLMEASRYDLLNNIVIAFSKSQFPIIVIRV
jgi:hypothetical protein